MIVDYSWGNLEKETNDDDQAGRNQVKKRNLRVNKAHLKSDFNAAWPEAAASQNFAGAFIRLCRSMHRSNCFCIICALIALLSNPLAAQELRFVPAAKPIDHIVAVVNEDVITRQELDDAVANALQPLRSTAITLLNQSVLLAGVNDREDALADLCERLFAIGVLPYYVHQLDRVAGAAHFLVPDEQACALQQALLARLPGYLVPRFVREVPDAPSKVPIGRANAVSTAGCGPPPELPRT